MLLKIKSRLLSAVLCVAVLLTSVPINTLNVRGDDTEGPEYLVNPGAKIGNTAMFNIEDWANYHICDNPAEYDEAWWEDDNYWIYNELVDKDEIPDDTIQMVITNYYYDKVLDYLWYSVEAAPGYELPEKLANKPFILHQDNQGYPDSLFIEDGGKNYILDAEGNVISNAVLPFYETVTLQSVSTLQGKVEYQWQILADDLWVDIYGENEAVININIGMLFNVLEGETAYVRCISTSGSKSVVGEAIPITVEAYNTEESMMFMENSYDAAVVADEVTYFYVTVKYEFANGMEAANPFIAQVSENGELKTTVTFPTVQGYLPYYEDEQLNTMDISIDRVTENVVYTVTYLPTAVEYKVAVYFQNVENDNYTFQSVETLKGLTGSKVPQNTVTYTGMYELLHETPEIAANGSTLVEVYFNRSYYLTRFELDGGFGVYSIYARYGAELAGIVGTPIRPGYTFVGWDDVTSGTGDRIADTIPDTVQAKERVYKALWKQNETAKVRIVFWGENPNDEGYAYIESKELYVKPGAELKFGIGQLVCVLDEHEHGASCKTTCGKTEESHTDVCYGNCTEADHKHTTECYDNVGEKYNNPPQNAPSNPVDGQIFVRYYGYYKYIYISGSWYEYSGTAKSETILTPNDSCEGHDSLTDHTEACFSCSHHTHTAECYECIQHRHTEACYLKSTMDSSLWTLVKSDTVTVAADGSAVMNVYYDRTTFTLTFHYNYESSGWSGSYRTEEIIEDKWGADIGKRFLQVNTNAKGNLWSTDDGGGSPWTSYLQIMPKENRDYYCRNTSTKEQSAKYYIQATTGEYVLKFTVTAYYGSDLTISKEDFYDMEGYSYSHGTDGDGKNMSSPGSYGDFDGAEFYYNRSNYILDFYNGNSVVQTEAVPYLQPLSAYESYTPPLPSEYEAGSREFKGWYLNPECTGDPVDLTTLTMPAENLALYAKWDLVKHQVNIYKEKLDDGSFGEEALPDGVQPAPVIHGSTVFETGYKLPDPENPPYKFIGWFYMEGDDERMWDFEHSVVVRDTDIYAKWSSEVLVPYTVRFVVKNDDGSITEIAEPISSSSLAGTTVTFQAKGGVELYKDYQVGYFPITTSHSLTMDIHKAETGMTYEFAYVKKPAAPYTVYYVDKEGKELKSPKVVSNNVYAIVTEKFEYIQGYVPDEYQKMLVIDADSENKIVFVYTKSDTQSVYNVTHYVQNNDGTTYMIHSTYGDIGQIGDDIKITPLTLTGFTYKRAEVNGTEVSLTDGTVNGTIQAIGLDIKLYYDRNKYPYKIQYLDKDTLAELQEPVKKAEGAYYGTIVSEDNPPSIVNYQLSDVVSCYIVEDSEEAVKNIVTVYYTEILVEIKYEVIGPGGCGKVNPEVTKVKALTGTGASSTATANEGFLFEGWYKDKACTNLVTKDATLNLLKPDNNQPWVAATYYAKFIPALGDLTIVRADAAEDDQVFVYEVKNTVSGESIYVTITGNGKVTIHDLPLGKYKVTQQNGWSWRYGDAARNVEVESAEEAEVTFEDTATKAQWLSGNSNLIPNRRRASE